MLLDSSNQTLLERVSARLWGEPPLPRYDLIALGGGTAGLVSAAGAALLGARAALVERHLMGGDCLVTGCVPSKAMLRAARAAHEARRAGTWGVKAQVEVDFPQVMERLRRVRSEMAANDGGEVFRRRGVSLLAGSARFLGPDRIDLEGREIRFKRAVIATGGKPRMPEIPGLPDSEPLTSENLFELTELPGRLLVIGGGPVGCEMAQAMARLGSQVTLLQGPAQLLSRDDPEASQLLLQAFREEGIEVHLGCRPRAVVRRGQEWSVELPQGGSLGCDRILVAVGRTPHIEGLNLEAAGVRYGPHGVEVDALQRTSNPRVYAAGDVCSPWQFTHAAYAQAEHAVLNALLPLRLKAGSRPMPWTTYTDPEVAHVGPSWSALQGLGSRVRVLTLPLADCDRAVLEGESRGFARVYLPRRGDRLLAATVVGQGAGELIGQLSLAMGSGVGLMGLARCIYPYPTRSEILRKLADQYSHGMLSPWVRRLLGWWMRALR